VLGITSNKTNNGGDITQHTAEAERVVKLCAAWGKIPVKAGANDDYADIKPNINNASFDGKEAVDFIIAQAHISRPQKLILLPVGKITNIALALDKDASIIPKVKVVWLGSNWPGTGEYNLVNDIGAVNAVIDTDVEFWICTVSGGTAAVKASTSDINSNMPGKGPYIDPPVPGRHGGTFHYFGDYSVSLFAHVSQTSRSLFDMAAVATVKNPGWAQPTVIGAPLLKSDGSWEARDSNTRKVTFFRSYNVSAVMNDFWETMDHPAGFGPYALFSMTTEALGVSVDAASSTASEGKAITGYSWDFGDGTKKSGRTATHTYGDYGSYTIALIVEEEGGGRDTATKKVHIHDGSSDNNPDASVNLALLASASLSGNAGARGSLKEVLYDPAKNDYAIKTDWNEYGVAFNRNLGKLSEADALYWMVQWPVPKAVNYITLGGAYPNQPQPNTQWKVAYRLADTWTALQNGKGGWINCDIYEWNAQQSAIVADAVRVKLYSDGTNDVVSAHIRGRGGVSNNEDDSATPTKAVLIQYLPGGATKASNAGAEKTFRSDYRLQYVAPNKLIVCADSRSRKYAQNLRIVDACGKTVLRCKNAAIGSYINCSLSEGVYIAILDLGKYSQTTRIILTSSF
jgi:PKD repeat protein